MISHDQWHPEKVARYRSWYIRKHHIGFVHKKKVYLPLCRYLHLLKSGWKGWGHAMKCKGAKYTCFMKKGKNERIGNNVHDHVDYFPLFDHLGCKGNLAIVAHGSTNLFVTPLGSHNTLLWMKHGVVVVRTCCLECESAISLNDNTLHLLYKESMDLSFCHPPPCANLVMEPAKVWAFEKLTRSV